MVEPGDVLTKQAIYFCSLAAAEEGCRVANFGGTCHVVMMYENLGSIFIFGDHVFIQSRDNKNNHFTKLDAANTLQETNACLRRNNTTARASFHQSSLPTTVCRPKEIAKPNLNNAWTFFSCCSEFTSFLHKNGENNQQRVHVFIETTSRASRSKEKDRVNNDMLLQHRRFSFKTSSFRFSFVCVRLSFSVYEIGMTRLIEQVGMIRKHHSFCNSRSFSPSLFQCFKHNKDLCIVNCIGNIMRVDFKIQQMVLFVNTPSDIFLFDAQINICISASFPT